MSNPDHNPFADERERTALLASEHAQPDHWSAYNVQEPHPTLPHWMLSYLCCADNYNRPAYEPFWRRSDGVDVRYLPSQGNLGPRAAWVVRMQIGENHRFYGWPTDPQWFTTEMLKTVDADVPMALRVELETSPPPWPPLSREQVVELHEALVRFSGHMEAASEMGDEDGMGREALAAGWLWEVVRRLHIGTPPAPPQPEPTPVRHNCWTCKNYQGAGCRAPLNVFHLAMRWRDGQKLDALKRPTDLTVTGCPAWEVKP